MNHRRIKSFCRLLLAVGLVAACGAPQLTSSPTPTSSAGRLPTISRLGNACAGVGMDGVLMGAADDPRVAWLRNNLAPGRVEIVFPPGFTARFSPRLEILDAAGVVMAREGDHIDGGCVISLSESYPLLVLWDGSK